MQTAPACLQQCSGADRMWSDQIAVRVNMSRAEKQLAGQVAWITGEGDIEEEWDDYLAELEKIGLDELLDIFFVHKITTQ